MKPHQRLDRRARKRIYSRLIQRTKWKLFEKAAQVSLLAVQTDSVIRGIRSQSFERPTGKVMIIGASTGEQREVDGSELTWHGCATKEEFIAKKKAKIVNVKAALFEAVIKINAEITEIKKQEGRYERAAK